MVNVLVVGAGITGATIARRYADDNHQVTVVDKRRHIAGNCYDYIDEATQVRVNKYGAHLFHTNNDRVWSFINRFSEWVRWDHRVVASVDDKLVPVPVNMTTVNMLCGQNIQTQEEMQAWLESVQVKYEGGPSNGREMALSRVGPDLYQAIFETYTRKQWDKDASKLDASVLARIPVRDNVDDRYFSDRYQALPRDGYTAFVAQMLNGIEVHLDTDFFAMDKASTTSSSMQAQ